MGQKLFVFLFMTNKFMSSKLYYFKMYLKTVAHGIWVQYLLKW